ncbi:hypothetical protein ABI011_14700 [Enterococcus faecium]|uniref:hypothetical protein n=1 Tax=Enterococcus faecium TaxID=1352 RepID=UPI003F428BA3
MSNTANAQGASAAGLLLCLRRLAEEAATLDLQNTARLILGAADAAAKEGARLTAAPLAYLN